VRPPASSVRQSRMPGWLQLPLVICVAMFAGMFATSDFVGQLAIVAYGGVAWWRRIPSRVTFTLALVSVIAMGVVLIGQGNIRLAQTFATYTFLFLVTAVLGLGRELRKEGGRVYSIRTHTNN